MLRTLDPRPRRQRAVHAAAHGRPRAAVRQPHDPAHRGATPRAPTSRTASDALWYTIVTISTVGYGDQYPVTNPGRIVGVVIIVVGVGIFGTFTGYLANLFLAPRKDDGGEEPVPADSAAAASTEAAPATAAGVDPGEPAARPVDTEATLDEIRSLLTRSEADLESIKHLLGGPERPTS